MNASDTQALSWCIFGLFYGGLFGYMASEFVHMRRMGKESTRVREQQEAVRDRHQQELDKAHQAYLKLMEEHRQRVEVLRAEPPQLRVIVDQIESKVAKLDVHCAEVLGLYPLLNERLLRLEGRAGEQPLT